MGELLLGGARPRPGAAPKDPDPGKAFPGGEIYLSMPGLGDRLAARVAGEIGEHFEQFSTPSALQCYAGRAPVTRPDGLKVVDTCFLRMNAASPRLPPRARRSAERSVL